MIYELSTAYWKSDFHTMLITDDIYFARTCLLHELHRRLGQPMSASEWKELDDKFQTFLSDQTRYMYFSERDYNYRIRIAQFQIAIGGLSTIVRANAQ